MSATQELPTATEPTPEAAPARSRRTIIVAGALATTLIAGVGAGFALRGTPAPAQASDPISLPDSVSGLSALPAAADVTSTAAWQARAHEAAGRASVAARSYGSGGQSARTVRIVLARTDLTGKLEQAWAAPTGAAATGADTCTNNTVLTAGSQPRVRPTVMLCWRTSPSFSGYALIIDPKVSDSVAAKDGAEALDEAWKAANGPM